MSTTKQMELDIETWRQLKIQSAKEDLPMKKIVEKAVAGYLNSPRARAHAGPSKMSPSHKRTMQLAQELKDYKQVTHTELDPLIGRIVGHDSRNPPRYIKALVSQQVLVPERPGLWRVNHEDGWLPYHLNSWYKG